MTVCPLSFIKYIFFICLALLGLKILLTGVDVRVDVAIGAAGAGVRGLSDRLRGGLIRWRLDPTPRCMAGCIVYGVLIGVLGAINITNIII